MKDMKRLFGYMGPYKKDMILGALFVMIETGFELFIPIMISISEWQITMSIIFM